MRVPVLPTGAIVDDKGFLTDVGKDFFNELITELQGNFSNEGLVSPSQSTTDINTIVGNQPQPGNYTCKFGTMIYDTATRQMKAVINDGTGVPELKTVQLV